MALLEGKTVLVTGASSGIGEACARRFAREGADLSLVARRIDRVERLAGGLVRDYGVSVSSSRLDVRDRDAVRAFAAEVAANGRVPDVLINNAGLASGLDNLQNGDYEDWDRMIETNVTGLLNITREILPLMVDRDSGHIINIGSVAGHIVYPGGNVYNATKFAVRALTDAMNIDLVGTQVRVCSVDPGATETEFSEVRFHGDKARASGVYDGFEPLQAEDVADAVCYVALAPAHVNIVNLVMLPTAQRNPYVLHRRSGEDDA